MQHHATRSIAVPSLLTLCSCIFGLQLFASPLPPVIRASTSENGKFLAVETLELGPAGEGGGRPILSTTFDVSPVETFLNNKDKLTAPNQYYSYMDWNNWSIRLPRDTGLLTPWPIISDDGETLVLVGVKPPVSGTTLLAIYKRHDHDGILLRTYKVDDLWTLKPGEKWMDGFNDATPEWFADGKFSFSSDGQILQYTDKAHGQLQISLKNGEVTRCSADKPTCAGEK